MFGKECTKFRLESFTVTYWETDVVCLAEGAARCRSPFSIDGGVAQSNGFRDRVVRLDIPLLVL